MAETPSAEAKEDAAKERFNVHAGQIEALGEYSQGAELTPEAIAGMSDKALYALHGPNGRQIVKNWMRTHGDELERAGNVRYNLIPDIEYVWADASLQEILGALRINLSGDQHAVETFQLKQRLDELDAKRRNQDSVMAALAGLGLILVMVFIVAFDVRPSIVGTVIILLFAMALAFISLVGTLRSDRAKRKMVARHGDYAKKEAWAWN